MSRRRFFAALLAAPVAVRSVFSALGFVNGRWFSAPALVSLHGTESVITVAQLATFKAQWDAASVGPGKREAVLRSGLHL